MARQSPQQKRIVGRVMHEFKEGELESSAGGRIRSPRQAVAIALSEAGASNRASDGQNRKRLRHTREASATASPTRAELYEAAKRAGVRNRSKMSKDQLRRAVAQA